MITKEALKNMKSGELFATGTGTFEELDEREIRWVAVRGGIHDWAIYYHLPIHSKEYIAKNGDKIFTKSVIKRLVPCNDEAFNLYKY